MRVPSIICLLFVMLGSCNSSSEKKKQYIASLNKSAGGPQDAFIESIKRGSLVYEDFCVSCHMPDGKGVEGSFPPLAGSDYLQNQRAESIRGVKYGQEGEIMVNEIKYNGVMAAMGLENDEVADVMNYIMNSWGNTQKEMVTLKEVDTIKPVQ